jgi:hypothetical protein
MIWILLIAVVILGFLVLSMRADMASMKKWIENKDDVFDALMEPNNGWARRVDNALLACSPGAAGTNPPPPPDPCKFGSCP